MKIIAEAAINWDSLEEAKEMIRECKRLNLYLCKFQLFNESNIVNPIHKDYCLKRMLDYEKAEELVAYGHTIGQEVFFTTDFPESVSWVKKLGCKYIKIRHYDRNNVPITIKAFNSGLKVFVSCDLEEMGKFGKIPKVIPLYCIPKYPARFSDYKKIPLGVSDHTPDLTLLKACKLKEIGFIERHVCLKKEGCLEAEWASTFTELEEALRE